MRWTLFFVVFALTTSQAIGRESNRGGYPERSKATITEKGDKRIIESNGLPNHEPGQFPNGGNPNSISEQHYRLEMPLKPQASDEPVPLRRYLFGIAINGVVFDPGTAEVWSPGDKIVSRPGPNTRMGPGIDRGRIWNYDGMGRMNLGIDSSHAHVQPTGAYHYHGLPTGLIERLRKEHGKEKMLLIGYAADGFPIYDESGHTKANDASSPLKKLKSSYQLKKGKRPTGESGPGQTYDGTFVQDYEFIKDIGDLDQCNGREGVTPEYPAGSYYYVVTETFPFIPRFFHGKPDPSFEKQGPPGGGPGGPPLGRGRRGDRRAPPPFPGDGPPPN